MPCWRRKFPPLSCSYVKYIVFIFFHNDHIILIIYNPPSSCQKIRWKDKHNFSFWNLHLFARPHMNTLPMQYCYFSWFFHYISFALWVRSLKRIYLKRTVWGFRRKYIRDFRRKGRQNRLRKTLVRCRTDFSLLFYGIPSIVCSAHVPCTWYRSWWYFPLYFCQWNN